MNFRKNISIIRNVKNISLFLFFGICLFLIGIYIYSQTPSISLIYQNTFIPSNPSVITTAKVTRVIDGDTIIIDTGQHVRYIGMNTPELETSECFATQAAETNKNLVLGKEIRLEKDTSEIDKYGRLLRYVYLEGSPTTSSGQISLFINDYLVKFGAAKIETVPPDTRYKQEFLDSENYAKENKLGLWGKCF